MKGRITAVFRVVPVVFVTMAILLAWSGARQFDLVNRVILPSPQSVMQAFVAEFPTLLWHASITMGSAVLGLLLAFIVSFALAAGFYFSGFFRRGVYPYAIALKATPLVAVAPFIVLLFGSGIESKIVMAAIVAFFPILIALWDGIERTDPQLQDYFSLLGASKSQEFWQLRVPAAIPELLSGLKVAVTLAVVGTIIAEFTGSSVGLGFIIKNASYYLRMDTVFAAIFAIAIGSLSLFLLVVAAEKIFLKRSV